MKDKLDCMDAEDAGLRSGSASCSDLPSYVRRLESVLCAAICIIRGEAEIAGMSLRPLLKARLLRFVDDLIEDSGMDVDSIMARH